MANCQVISMAIKENGSASEDTSDCVETCDNPDSLDGGSEEPPQDEEVVHHSFRFRHVRNLKKTSELALNFSSC